MSASHMGYERISSHSSAESDERKSQADGDDAKFRFREVEQNLCFYAERNMVRVIDIDFDALVHNRFSLSRLADQVCNQLTTLPDSLLGRTRAFDRIGYS